MYSQRLVDEHQALCVEFISKSADGEWKNELHRIEFKHVGLSCMMVRNFTFGHWCGYVGVPPGHPAHGKAYADLDVHIHGGITYANGCDHFICHKPDFGEPDELYWIGFDCAHFGDVSPFYPYKMGSDPKLLSYKNEQFVIRETKRLAEQLAEMTAKI